MKILFAKSYSLPQLLNIIRKRQSKASEVREPARKIIAAVCRGGDKALFALTKKFDGAKVQSLRVTKQEIATAYLEEGKDFIVSLKIAKANIEKFHRNNLQKERAVITTKGVEVWREFRPIEKVGLYVPGGKAVYPSTVLMLAIPAKIAGCNEIILCVPPDKLGKVPNAVLVAADMCGITKIFKVGGAQAIAAMAYGTKSIPKVYKIFGPGNQFVTTAKMLVYGEVDIDMPAGPSEVLIYADESGNESWIAADLLSQLEHGEDSQAIFVTTDEALARKVKTEVARQSKTLARKAIVKKSLINSFIVIVKNSIQACRLINGYAPEHLEIVANKGKQMLKNINNAGSIFLGKYASEPLGDYATGSNHTLPTSGYAKMFSALSVESFGKKMQIQKVSKTGIRNLRRTVEILAAKEGLTAHKNAVSIRFNQNL